MQLAERLRALRCPYAAEFSSPLASCAFARFRAIQWALHAIDGAVYPALLGAGDEAGVAARLAQAVSDIGVAHGARHGLALVRGDVAPAGCADDSLPSADETAEFWRELLDLVAVSLSLQADSDAECDAEVHVAHDPRQEIAAAFALSNRLLDVVAREAATLFSADLSLVPAELWRSVCGATSLQALGPEHASALLAQTARAFESQLVALEMHAQGGAGACELDACEADAPDLATVSERGVQLATQLEALARTTAEFVQMHRTELSPWTAMPQHATTGIGAAAAAVAADAAPLKRFASDVCAVRAAHTLLCEAVARLSAELSEDELLAADVLRALNESIATLAAAAKRLAAGRS